MNEIQHSDVNEIQRTDTNKSRGFRNRLIGGLRQSLIKPNEDNHKSYPFRDWLVKKISVYLETLDAAEKLENEYEFNTKSHVLELIVIIVCVGFLSIIIEATTGEKWSEILKIAVPLCVAVIAYRQWRAARQEISIDKYYDRLDVVNKRLQDVTYQRPTSDDLYAFAELDRLEYVVVKYEHGFISPVLALRAVENMKAICRDRHKFDEIAYHWVTTAAYREGTRKVVKKVCEKCKQSQISPQNNI